MLLPCGDRMCSGHPQQPHGDCRRALGALRFSALPAFSLRAARVTAIAGGVSRALFYVKSEPVQKSFVPELRILRLEHPVALVGEDHELRRNALALQRAEKFQRLRV